MRLLLWRLKAGDGWSSMAMTGGRSQREKRNRGRRDGMLHRALKTSDVAVQGRSEQLGQARACRA
jgi:hypothetical protein